MILGLKPFWRYFGGKWRLAPTYPRPEYDTIIEPFAGAAGYSLRYPHHKVVLVEAYPVVARIWQYLIAVSASEIRRIPLVDSVDDLPSWVPREARWLVGYNLNSACVAPSNVISSGMRRRRLCGGDYYGWSEKSRARVASQVDAIRHWTVIEGDYHWAPDDEATWFVDPPYQAAGTQYYGHDKIDFTALGDWCRTRRGQAIVCENVGATWLPFRPHAEISGFAGTRSGEAIWTNMEDQT